MVGGRPPSGGVLGSVPPPPPPQATTALIIAIANSRFKKNRALICEKRNIVPPFVMKYFESQNLY
jgi:hypothetical protein